MNSFATISKPRVSVIQIPGLKKTAWPQMAYFSVEAATLDNCFYFIKRLHSFCQYLGWGRMTQEAKFKVVWAVVLVSLVIGEPYIGILPMLGWGLGFPLLVIAYNWRALKFSKKRGGKSKTLDLYEDYYKKDKAEE